MIDTALARYNIYDIGVSPLSHICYIEPCVSEADCSHVPPGGRRGRAIASVGDKQPSEIPLYIALVERVGSGLFTCAPWGAEGASFSERRGQQPSEIPLYIALKERVCRRMIILKSIR